MAQIDKLRKKFSYVFQDTALFDSMTVYHNIALPVREGTSLLKSEIRKRVEDKLQLFELQGVYDKYPRHIIQLQKLRTVHPRKNL